MQDDTIHDLVEFMRQVSDEIASEYQRIRRRTLEDPGTAGDQGEENWASLPREWLPSTYTVVTKGRIIGEDGRISPQVDVVVLKDVYPKKLLDKKLYLAGGVAAAFECKTTLRSEHIAKAAETCVGIKRLFPAQTGTLYRELHAPILFGLLAHSHDWKSTNSRPMENVAEKLRETDRTYATHPRESMDILCVADLDTWTLKKLALLPSDGVDRARQLGVDLPTGPEYAKGLTWTSHHGHAKLNQPESFTPIGSLIASLSRKLAWENPSLRQLAEYYPKTGIGGPGGGTVRFWAPLSVYSEGVHAQLPGRLSGDNWSEWGNSF